MLCPECGKETADAMAFCSICGSQLTKAQPKTVTKAERKKVTKAEPKEVTEADDHGLTINEAASRLSKNAKTIRRWIEEGRLAARKVVEEGREVWHIDLDKVLENGLVISRSNAQDVLLEKDEEITTLREEASLLKNQLAEKDRQISEVHVLLARTQPKQLEEAGKKRWWQFWKR